MSRPGSAFQSSGPTPALSVSPPPSESFQSDLDGASLLDGSTTEYGFDASKLGEGSGLNLVSWKMDVDAGNEDGVDKRGFNAISTVLNHPTKKADPLRGTRKPLPPIANPPALPRPPPPSHYDSYLQAVTPLYDTFVNAQASSSTAVNGRNNGVDPIHQERRANLPSLDNVPEMYFDPTFDISSSATWASILDSQDELSTHFDTLESHLIHEITLRSTSFFSALSNLQDLHSESASCLAHITDLQESLKEIGEKQARKGLQIIDQHEELRLLRGVDRGVREIGEAQQAMAVAQGLVDGGDWAGAIGCLDDVVNWWGKHAPSQTDASGHLPLASLTVLSSLPEQFSNMKISIADQLESAFSALLSSILSRVEDSDTFDEERFRSSVEPMLSGLTRCGSSDKLQDIWREAVTVSIREGSRRHLPVAPAELDEEDGKDSEPRGMNLAQSLRSMDHSRYLLLATEMYSTLLSRLHLVQRIGDALSQMLERDDALPSLTISTVEEAIPTRGNKSSMDLSDILSSACELANARAAKILGVRAEQHAALSITEFVEIFKENWDFVVATETLAKRMIVSLRGVTATQARTFLIAYHGARLTKSAKAVEDEQWTQIDVSHELQHTVNLIVSSATEDSAECLIPARLEAPNGNGSGGTTKQLNIEDRGFFIVKATSETLVLLADYLKIVINLELVVMDVMSRIIEYLKSFNSRTCQVVLGAGAMRSAGLKNITAKHLALASQSLSIVVALIPYIREFIRRHLNPKQAVMLTEFDKLKRDYQEHQNEIHAKLVAIMSDRLSVHVAALREIDWEASTEKAGPQPYVEMLVKETATLHKVLSKYLASSTVETVLAEVLGAIVTRLGEEYGKIELKSDDAKKRMMTDVTVIAQRLGPIAEAGKDMTKLQTLVKDKPVPRKNVSQAMAGLLKRSTSKKEAEQEEAPSAESADKDGGDEDGESLGILPEDHSNEKEDTGPSDLKGDEATVPDAPAEDSTSLSSTSEKPPKVETDAASIIPPKDAVAETKKLEPDNEDAPIATEILTAPQEEKELPVAPFSPVDQVHSSTDDIIVEEPPAPPLKDETERAQKTDKDVDGPPETPSK